MIIELWAIRKHRKIDNKKLFKYSGIIFDLTNPENKVGHKSKAKHKMKKTITLKIASIILSGTVLLASCASTTIIQSTPSGAKLYLNGENVGQTPYTHTDTKIIGSTTTVKLVKEEYETLNTSFSRNEQADVGAIIGGLFVWVPFLWTMKYKPTHTYELSPLADNQSTISLEKKQNTRSKAERLRELKQLLDEKIITQKEFEKEKKKILDE